MIELSTEKHQEQIKLFFSIKKFKVLISAVIVSMLLITSLLFTKDNTDKSILSKHNNGITNKILKQYFFYDIKKEKDTNKLFNTNSNPFSVKIIMEDFHSMPKVVDFFDCIGSQDYRDNIATQFAKYLKLNTKIHSNDIDRDDFEKWIIEQAEISFANLKNNIADDNLNNNTFVYSSKGMIEGIVLASPSAENPNYFYDWTRDTAITMNTIVNAIAVGLEKEQSNDFSDLNFKDVEISLFGTILKYMNRTYTTQRTKNLSGGFLEDNLKGFGEPKWEVNGNDFEGPWGRPQNDGPALRATTFLHFLKVLNEFDLSFQKVFNILGSELLDKELIVFENEQDFYNKILYYDLQFVIQNWSNPSFDLWEEVNGNHFFTSMVQMNAIKLGVELLETNNWDSPDGTPHTIFINQLKQTYNDILYFIKYRSGYQNGFTNYIIENPQYKQSRSGLDIATLIATILTHDPVTDGTLTSVPFNYNDSYILNSLHELSKQMGVLYPINHSLESPDLGVSLGRYPEDVYNGNGVSEGNPWFLATATGGELIYGYIHLHLKNKMDIALTASLSSWDQTFWSTFFTLPRGIDDDVNLEYNLIIPYGTPLYVKTLNSMMNYADSFLDQVRQHVSDKGNMSEQFNKYNGYQEGARDLTWSYGTFWNTIVLRTKTQAEFKKITTEFK
ncbi:hypothetical protein QEN19_000199 [Hanseniaspora menglaensis]